MAQIFISYSKHNIDFARHLRGLLQGAGFEVWMDEIRLATSQHWAETLETSINNCTIFMIILSPESKASQWVSRELLLAERLNKAIFPVLYSGDAWWNLANIQYEDMRDGLQATLSKRMVDSLNAVLSGKVQIQNDPPLPSQTDSRRLEAAMPAETKATAETEVWAKISLLASEGLRGELPAVVSSGDVIQKGDSRATSFPIRFPLDPQSGRRLPAHAELRVISGDFVIVAPGETASVEIPPEMDSRTVIFTLQPKPDGKTSGRSRVFIDLIYEMKIIAQISVSTQLVERVTAAIPTWNLMSASVAPPEAEAAALSEALVDDVIRGAEGVPLTLPEVDVLDLEDEAFEDEAPDPDDILDEFPAYDDGAEPITPIGDFQALPAMPAEAAESVTRSRRRWRPPSTVMLRFAAATASILLVFVVVAVVGRNAVNLPVDVSATQFSLASTEEVASAVADIAVAPMVNCAGTPGETFASLLQDAGFNVSLLDAGITDQAVARSTGSARVVAWGACSGDALWLYVELLNPLGREALNAPPTITLIIPVGAVEQADSYTMRLVSAVTEYARGDSGAELAQTFANLAATAMDDEDAAALQLLQQNVESTAAQ